jgi:hypothetical protein
MTLTQGRTQIWIMKMQVKAISAVCFVALVICHHAASCGSNAPYEI